MTWTWGTPISELEGRVLLSGTFFEFSTPSVVAREGAGSVELTVRRMGDLSLPASVRAVGVSVTATAGADFEELNRVLAFPSGVTEVKLSVAIAADDLAEQAESFIVRLEDARYTAYSVGRRPPMLTENAATVVTILDAGGGSGPRVAEPPRALAGPDGVNGFAIRFDRALDPSRATDPANYRLELDDLARLNPFNRTTLAIAGATYDASTWTVTLTTTRALPSNLAYRVSIAGGGPLNPLASTSLYSATVLGVSLADQIGSGPGRGLADLAGNLLDGDGDGARGGNAVWTVAPAPAAVVAPMGGGVGVGVGTGTGAIALGVTAGTGGGTTTPDNGGNGNGNGSGPARRVPLWWRARGGAGLGLGLGLGPGSRGPGFRMRP